VRTAFLETLFECAARDHRICLVVGDLGYSVVEQFAAAYPKQFLNVGVAEQNMTGIAAGMALTGKIVFTYSIANFSTLRPLEQIRNDVCYHRANVKVVSVGGGLAYGALGMTHHATEDLAIMRSMPGMTVVAPGDSIEARLATRAVIEHDGPCYLRLGKVGEPIVHLETPAFQLGQAIRARDGANLTLISTGALLDTAVKAADLLSAEGVFARVLSMHTLSPLDVRAITSAAFETPYVITLEEHSVRGGLGGAVAEVLAELEQPHARLRLLGLQPALNAVVGDHAHLRSLAGLDLNGVMYSIRSVLALKSGTPEIAKAVSEA
jgi:transketolase